MCEMIELDIERSASLLRNGFSKARIDANIRILDSSASGFGNEQKRSRSRLCHTQMVQCNVNDRMIESRDETNSDS